jgi:galactokinase
MSAADLFAATFGRPAHGSWSAPGRVNLIGEHTDYNNGLVLPFAIDARASVAAARNDDGVVRVTSAQRPGAPVELPLTDIRPGGSGHDWSSYLFGVHWVLTQSGLELGGADLALDSQVPVGAGLSSSAAVECATGLALTALFDHRLDPAELARVAQQAENDYVGMPCGLMDQMASATCRAGNVLFFDVGAETTENIPFDTAASGLSVLVIDTRAHHSLADGEYAKRRASCEQAVAQLGLDSLRDIGFGDLSAALDRLDDDVLRRRVRHIVTENERVTAVVQRLRSGAVADIGPDLTASHVSLRDDYEVSAAELDLAVDAALAAGALGARMTGGGFGGSVIALVPDSAADAVGVSVTEAFAARSLTLPVIRSVTPADGARAD